MPAALVSIGPKVDSEVVEYLEDALRKARAGEISGVLILSQNAGGLGYAIAGINDRFTTAGWLYHAMHKLQTDPPK